MSEHLSPVPSAAIASRRPELWLDWCSLKGAEYACERWHYSRNMPAGKLVKLGAWEDGRFVGVIIFGRGGNYRLAGRVSLSNLECVELTRVALRKHRTSVSRIVTIALRLFRHQSPGIRCVFAYADPVQNHHGGVYQAMGFDYLGHSVRCQNCWPWD
jgi:hypothetical protein